MPQGTLELSIFGFIFLSLQVFWISQTLKGHRDKGVMFKTSKGSLEEMREELEKLFRK